MRPRRREDRAPPRAPRITSGGAPVRSAEWFGCLGSHAGSLAHRHEPRAARWRLQWSRGCHREPARLAWHSSSTGRVLLQFWAGLVPRGTVMLPGLGLDAGMGSWRLPHRVR